MRDGPAVRSWRSWFNQGWVYPCAGKNSLASYSRRPYHEIPQLHLSRASHSGLMSATVCAVRCSTSRLQGSCLQIPCESHLPSSDLYKAVKPARVRLASPYLPCLPLSQHPLKAAVTPSLAVSVQGWVSARLGQCKGRGPSLSYAGSYKQLQARWLQRSCSRIGARTTRPQQNALPGPWMTATRAALWPRDLRCRERKRSWPAAPSVRASQTSAE